MVPTYVLLRTKKKTDISYHVLLGEFQGKTFFLNNRNFYRNLPIPEEFLNKSDFIWLLQPIAKQKEKKKLKYLIALRSREKEKNSGRRLLFE